ncbi:MAG: cupin domain-containing protein [Dehalococcoidia bacterium]|nr:cupin domain-containing protein [Dehalococcoidia bacterium]
MAGELMPHPKGATTHAGSGGLVEHRPWGFYQVLTHGKDYQVKLLVVMPGECTSLQTHAHRSEFWVVVQGMARITRGAETRMMGQNETVMIPNGMRHRIEVDPGAGEVQIIEVLTGSIIDENDIVRLQDRYGRVSQTS